MSIPKTTLILIIFTLIIQCVIFEKTKTCSSVYVVEKQVSREDAVIPVVARSHLPTVGAARAECQKPTFSEDRPQLSGESGSGGLSRPLLIVPSYTQTIDYKLQTRLHIAKWN